LEQFNGAIANVALKREDLKLGKKMFQGLQFSFMSLLFMFYCSGERANCIFDSPQTQFGLLGLFYHF
jgi:hypothetical protein